MTYTEQVLRKQLLKDELKLKLLEREFTNNGNRENQDALLQHKLRVSELRSAINATRR